MGSLKDRNGMDITEAEDIKIQRSKTSPGQEDLTKQQLQGSSAPLVAVGQMAEEDTNSRRSLGRLIPYSLGRKKWRLNKAV